MLQIDSLLIEAFFNENKSFLENSRVQKIQQPTRRDLILNLRKDGESKKLYININPDYPHLCFLNKEFEDRRNIEIPKQPPMFCMLLRKHMEGAKIIKVSKPNYERIVELTFEKYNEIGDRIEECLSIELMGKHSNIILYNTDNNIILGCAHNVGAEKSKERELSGGLPYIYPPHQNKKDILKTRFNSFENALKKSDETLKKTISSKYYYLSQFIVEEICISKNIDSQKISNILTTEEIQILYIALHEFLENKNPKYSVSKNYEIYSCINKKEKIYQNINTLIDDYYSYHIEKNLTSNLKFNLINKINKELKKLKNTLTAQQKQIDKKEKYNAYMTKGNLLIANAHNIKQGQKNILLKDYETNKNIKIELDETKTVIENAQKYFALYNKGKKSSQIAEELSEKTISEINYFNQILYDIEICDKFSELKEISTEFEADKDNYSKKVHNKKKEKEINITKMNVDGLTVYIGKNNKQNDYLYSKISSPDDLWFHTLNIPGSHIIVKLSNNSKKINDNTILKIAKLAKQYSKAKNALKTSVVYTLRKYIKRPNHTKSGFVVYKNETEIVIN